MLRLVLPKGSLEQQTLRLFEEADLRVRRGSDRDYHGSIDDERIERVSLLRPQEIPVYVQDGLFDLGITGQDWIAETEADVEVLVALSYAKSGTGHGTKVVLAVPAEHPANAATRDARRARGSRRSSSTSRSATSTTSGSTSTSSGRSGRPRPRCPRSSTRSSTSPRPAARSGRTA